MADFGKYEQFKNMQIEELKDEYYNCLKGEEIKKQMLKKIIKNKIISEREREKEKKLLPAKLTENNKNDKLVEKINKSIDKLIDLKQEEENKNKLEKLKTLEPIIKKRGNMEQYWESNQQIKKMDQKFVKEIGIDHSNNKLMERLNCELDFRIYGSKSEDILKPYSNQDTGNFKEFEKYSVPPTIGFRNR